MTVVTSDRPAAGWGRSRRRPHLLAGLGLALLLTVSACSGGAPASAARGISTSPTHPPTSAAAPSADPAAWPSAAPAGTPGYLTAGSDPHVLPGPVLIADKGNNRLLVVNPQGQILWRWPQPGDLAPGQTFLIPDDAFLTPDGKDIIATEEDDFVVTEIDIATRTIVWRFGTPGVRGVQPNQLNNPDDAMKLPDGTVVAADIKNCRLVDLSPTSTSPVWSLGGGPGTCQHQPPVRFGSPNGVFPLPNGHFLVTEIRGDWVDEIDRTGHVYWSAHPPAVAYPSDSSQYKPGQYVTVDYSNPGQVVVFDATGKTLWRWNPRTGDGKLDQPSLAEGLPNGDILLNDDANDRVIVLDPAQNRIVWQYGHTGVPGTAPGYLNTPDGLDPVPPHSYADTVGLSASAAPGSW